MYSSTRGAMLLQVRAPSKRKLIRCHAETASSLLVVQLSGCFHSAKSRRWQTHSQNNHINVRSVGPGMFKHILMEIHRHPCCSRRLAAQCATDLPAIEQAVVPLPSGSNSALESSECAPTSLHETMSISPLLEVQLQPPHTATHTTCKTILPDASGKNTKASSMHGILQTVPLQRSDSDAGRPALGEHNRAHVTPFRSQSERARGSVQGTSAMTLHQPVASKALVQCINRDVLY